jgi:hypothetical protein
LSTAIPADQTEDGRKPKRREQHFLKMPAEFRILTFSKDEVLEALKDYCHQAGWPVETAGIAELTLAQGAATKTSIRSSSYSWPIEFTDVEVAAALLMFCHKKGIPMPRRAVKSLEHDRETVSFRMRIDR